jgi:hypothetical protein
MSQKEKSEENYGDIGLWDISQIYKYTNIKNKK